MKSIRSISVIAVTVASVFVLGCKKDEHIPPTMNFKTTAGYTSASSIVGTDSTIKVGIIADKVEDDMISYNVSHAYDGATTTITDTTITLNGTEQQHVDRDITFVTRAITGSERWIFTITDKDGNIAQKELVLTVQ